MVPKLSDSPHVTERIHNCALKHSLDRNRAGSIVLGFVHRTVLDSAGGQSVGLHGDRIVNKSSILTVVKPTESGERVR